jgi:hypothetical protein
VVVVANMVSLRLGERLVDVWVVPSANPTVVNRPAVSMAQRHMEEGSHASVVKAAGEGIEVSVL